MAAILQAPTAVAPTGGGLRLRDLESKPNYGAQVTIQVSQVVIGLLSNVYIEVSI